MPRNSGENSGENSFGNQESVTPRHSGEAQSNRGGQERGEMSQKREHWKTGETTYELFSDDRSYQTADTVNSRLFGNGKQGRRRTRSRREPDTVNSSFLGNGTQGSRRTRSRLEPWNGPLKTRRQFNETFSWNGNRARFWEYRQAIMGHLLQVGAGYLLDNDFLTEYEIHRASHQHMEYLTSEAFWSKHGVPFAQAQYDRQYLYGILLSLTRKIDNKVILANEKDLDGILAWIQMRRNYDYGGSIQLRVEVIDVEVRKPYFNSPGGLSEHIERHQTLMAELNIIAPKEYTDNRKQQLLFANVRRAPGMTHLTDYCRVKNWSYDMSADFLLQKALVLEHDIATHAPEPVTIVTESVEEPSWLTTADVFDSDGNDNTNNGLLVRPMYAVDTSNGCVTELATDMEPDTSTDDDSHDSYCDDSCDGYSDEYCFYSISLRPGGNAVPRNSGRNSGENSFGKQESVTPRHSGEAQSNRGGQERGGMSQKREHWKTGETTYSHDSYCDDSHDGYSDDHCSYSDASDYYDGYSDDYCSYSDASEKISAICKNRVLQEIESCEAKAAQLEEMISATRKNRVLKEIEFCEAKVAQLEEIEFREAKAAHQLAEIEFRTRGEYEAKADKWADIEFRRMDTTMINGDEPEMSPATIHLADPSVLEDSGEEFDLADTEKTKFRRMHMCDIFDITRDTPLKPRKFPDDENHHTNANAIGTLPFVPEGPTVPDVFDPTLIRTSFDNLCKATYPLRTSFTSLSQQRQAARRKR
jgi:hypothetical protein